MDKAPILKNKVIRDWEYSIEHRKRINENANKRIRKKQAEEKALREAEANAWMKELEARAAKKKKC
jgi:hypothetical protein